LETSHDRVTATAPATAAGIVILGPAATAAAPATGEWTSEETVVAT
jgi:hypothetical protein